jgi:hypothetical protein
MRMTRIALLAASVFAVACSSDEATAPSPLNIETRLAATADVPVATLSDANVTMRVAVTSALQETVSGGVCAQTIEARTPSGTSWTDVTSSNGVCSAQAIVLAPGGTISINAIADQAKARTAAGSSPSLVLRARHTLAGASANYTLQSNEVTWQLP